MEDCKKLWNDSLALIRGKVDAHVYDVWFAPIVCKHYDDQANTVLLQVPSKYVYEYLEQCQVKLLGWALSSTFKPGVRLNYCIAEPLAINPPKDVFMPSPQRSNIAIPNARERLENGLKYYLGDTYQWLPAYDKVAEWLSDNKGRGLLCVGTSGLGKTMICRNILPVILGRDIVSCTAREMNNRIDDLLKERCVIIDDLGKEDVETRTYGNRRTPFFELCDAAEKRGILLIITTNLSTTPMPKGSPYPSSIEERYGVPTLDRLRATTKVAIFTGKSMRR